MCTRTRAQAQVCTLAPTSPSGGGTAGGGEVTATLSASAADTHRYESPSSWVSSPAEHLSLLPLASSRREEQKLSEALENDSAVTSLPSGPQGGCRG